MEKNKRENQERLITAMQDLIMQLLFVCTMLDVRIQTGKIDG